MFKKLMATAAVTWAAVVVAGCAADAPAPSSQQVSETRASRGGALIKVQCTTQSDTDLAPCAAQAAKACNGPVSLRGIESKKEMKDQQPRLSYRLYNIQAAYACESA